ncbi:MAG TPA: PadR family transcriptional regulator [Clostridia bacterium]|nr:PadR family transcriptional regulator [Clostridia bacterium]
MDIQLKKGLLNTCVLAAVSKSDVYGYQITQDILNVMEISESSLYPVLRRLEKQGYLTTYTREYSGRLRKYYSITPEGLKKLDEARKELDELKKTVDFIMGGKNNDA